VPAGYKLDQPKSGNWLDSVRDYAAGAWDNLMQTGQGMINTVAHPIETAVGIGKAQDALRIKAEDAFKRGDYVEGVRHVLDYAIPVVGPAIDQLGDQARSGQVARSLGGATALGLQLAGPTALARTVPAPPPGAAAAPEASGGIVSTTLNPTQQAAVDYLRANDVPLNAGTVTGNKFLKGAQALAQNQPLGAGVAATAARATEAGLTRVAGDLADQAHPAAVTPESAGAAVSDALAQKIANLKLREDESYGVAWKGADDPQYAEQVPVKTVQRPISDATGRPTGKTESVPVMGTVQMPVDVRGIKQQLGPVFDSMQWMPASDQASSAGYQAAKRILNGPDFIPAPAAEQGLGGLKTMARADNVNLRNTAQGMAAGLIPDLQEAVNEAVAKTGSDALAGLQDGRAAHASKMEIADLADQLRDEPVQTFNKLTWQNDTGIAFARKIADQAPDVLPQIGRAFITKLFDQATAEGGFSRAQGIAKQWENLGPQMKQLMYPNPGLRNSLDNFFLGAKLVSENPNPSGTAVVGSLIPGGMLTIHNPVMGGSWLLGGYAAAKLLFSPAGVKLLTGGLKAEAPGAAALRASQILRIAGDDDVTPVPPGGGGPPSTPGGGGAAEPIPAASPGVLNARPEGPNIPTGASDAGNADNGSYRPNHGEGAAVHPADRTVAAVGPSPTGGSATSIPVPGSSRAPYQANYAVRELADVQTSHNGLSFAPNEKYGLTNDRDYTRPENQSKIFNGATAGQFDPRYLITDNPDASNGPPLIDSSGNVLGGNGRGMTLQRVYANNPTGAQAYRDLLVQKAAQFGQAPARIQAMKQPVLVREIADSDVPSTQAKQTAVTNFNVKGTAELRPAEQAIADSRRVSQGTLDDIARRLDAKPDSSLAQILNSGDGADVLQRMIGDGAINPQEAAAYVSNGKLTDAGKARISKAMLGRFFRDPAQIDRTPAPVLDKLQRLAAPLAKVESQKGWSLTPHVHGALDLLEEARARGSNLDDALSQGGLFGDQKYSTQAIALAKQLQSAAPTALTQAVRAYAQDARFAGEGSGLFGEPPTPAQAFEAAFPTVKK
jgi:hypothetical protein